MARTGNPQSLYSRLAKSRACRARLSQGNSCTFTLRSALTASRQPIGCAVGYWDWRALVHFSRWRPQLKLLSISNDAKTVKGERKGYLTGILYLAPADTAGVGNLCPHSTPG